MKLEAETLEALLRHGHRDEASRVRRHEVHDVIAAALHRSDDHGSSLLARLVDHEHHAATPERGDGLIERDGLAYLFGWVRHDAVP